MISGSLKDQILTVSSLSTAIFHSSPSLTGILKITNCPVRLNTPRYVIHHTTMSNGGKHVISTSVAFHSVFGICWHYSASTELAGSKHSGWAQTTRLSQPEPLLCTCFWRNAWLKAKVGTYVAKCANIKINIDFSHSPFINIILELQIKLMMCLKTLLFHLLSV